MRTSRREDAVTVGLSMWLVIGLFVDGWAHNTQPALETFFTPWHALFYSGFTATAGWLLWLVARRLPEGARSWRALLRSSGRQAVPVGYGYALAGIGLFGLSGLGDLTWHQIFGIEQDVSALLSPTHLGLITGAFLILTAPARAHAAHAAGEAIPGRPPAGRPPAGRPPAGRPPNNRDLLPAVMSVALAGLLIAFILQSWHPLVQSPAGDHLGGELEAVLGPNAPWFADQLIVGGVPQYLMATIFLFGPLIWLTRTWRLPPSAPALVIGLQALFMQAMVGLEDPGLVALGLLGALAVAWWSAVVRPGPDSLTRVRVFAATGPLLFWGIHFAGIGPAGPGLAWEPELWGGCLIWSALVGLGMTLLLPTASPDRPART